MVNTWYSKPPMRIRIGAPSSSMRQTLESLGTVGVLGPVNAQRRVSLRRLCQDEFKNMPGYDGAESIRQPMSVKRVN